MMTSYITKIGEKRKKEKKKLPFWQHSDLFIVKINTIWGREGEKREAKPYDITIIIIWHYEMKNFQVAANLQSIHMKHKSLVYFLIFHNNSSHGWKRMSAINSLVTWVKVAVGHNSLTRAHTHTYTHILSYSKSKVTLAPSAPQSSAAKRNYIVIEDVLNVVKNGFTIKSKKVTHSTPPWEMSQMNLIKCFIQNKNEAPPAGIVDKHHIFSYHSEAFCGVQSW